MSLLLRYSIPSTEQSVKFYVYINFPQHQQLTEFLRYSSNPLFNDIFLPILQNINNINKNYNTDTTNNNDIINIIFIYLYFLLALDFFDMSTDYSHIIS